MSNPREIVTYSTPSTGFGPFICSRRTAAHLDYTKEVLAKVWPGTRLEVIQGCYHRGLGVSEGTHDYDCCVDIRIVGLSWEKAQRFIRSLGWFGWWRKPWQGPWSDHIHMISGGFNAYDIPVGIYIDGGLSQFGPPMRTSSQVVDYYNHAWGLEGMHDPGSDPSWYPPDINATIFDYEKWEQKQEENMGYRDWDQADKDALMSDIGGVFADQVKALPTKVWAFVVRKKDGNVTELTARAALRKSAEED